MNWLCHVTVRQLSPNNAATPTAKAESFLQALASIESALLPHLIDRRRCQTVQQIQEHYAFELHKNFAVSTMCSPLVSSGLFVPDQLRTSILIGRLQEALKRSARAYIWLRSVTSYARRSWAFIHNGLASVLLLSLMKETRNTTDVRELQDEVIRSLMDDEEGASIGFEAANQPSDTHKNALRALQRLRALSEQEDGDIGDFGGAWGGEATWTRGVNPGPAREGASDMDNGLQQPQPGYVAVIPLQPELYTNNDMGRPWDMDEWLNTVDPSMFASFDTFDFNNIGG